MFAQTAYTKILKLQNTYADYVFDPYSRSSDFALYLQQYLMDWHET